MSMTKMTVVGNITTVNKRNVGDERVAYNFGLAVDDGYGENKTTIFYNSTLFAKKGKQEEFMDKMIVVGNKLPCTGVMKPGKIYEKEGVTIHPWIFMIRDIGLGINEVTVSGRLTADAIVTDARDDCTIARFTLAVDSYGGKTNFIRVVKFGKGGFGDYARNYLKKGKKLVVMGLIQTGSYTNKDNQTIPTFEVCSSELKLWGNDNGDGNTSNNSNSETASPNSLQTASTPAQQENNSLPDEETYYQPDFGFENIPDNEEEDLPF